ncbi:hypothetical protein LNAOJCKE_0389 [Methylorubrum aminovorans]|uniref:TIGR02449 family protein n=1 Tax=Methylorubrum aminovorans TaxID=269069 RepID=A0ABQ4UAJ9_9HYPH|nr:hypothetical protein [Methylorubrum aminovorans]GJE63195.1 hypothetical protein LNAOJCKE_0389 [Methylorubrum aminovorans]
MISVEEAQILAAEIERLTVENDELRAQVDYLLRERMDRESLALEARKRAAEKVLLTVKEQALAAAERGDAE